MVIVKTANINHHKHFCIYSTSDGLIAQGHKYLSTKFEKIIQYCQKISRQARPDNPACPENLIHLDKWSKQGLVTIGLEHTPRLYSRPDVGLFTKLITSAMSKSSPQVLSPSWGLE